MFRTLIYPSSGACDYIDGLPHRLPCSVFVLYCLAPNTHTNNTTPPKTAIRAKTSIQIGVITETTSRSHGTQITLFSVITTVVITEKRVICVP